MRILRRSQTGLSLIELLVALVIGVLVIAGVYSTFTVQQKSYVVQEQVSEAQQSARAVMDIIANDIRMAGFGIRGWEVAGVANRIRIDQPSPADFTIVGVFSAPVALLQQDAVIDTNQIRLTEEVELTQGDNLLIFESDRPVLPILSEDDTLDPPLRHRPVVVSASTGTYSAGTGIAIDADGETPSPWAPGVEEDLDVTLRANALVYRVGTVRYQLNGNTLLRNGSLLASNVTDFQIAQLFDEVNPDPPESYGTYQVVLSVQTRTNDPDFPGGFRTRTLSSTIKSRNPKLN